MPSLVLNYLGQGALILGDASALENPFYRLFPEALILPMVVLAAVFLRVAVWPTFVHHYPFGVGPDMPVYLWWSRVGLAQGISVVGERPGTVLLLLRDGSLEVVL